MADSITGTDAPILMPSISGKAAPKSIAPVTDSACTMPTAAEADCSTAVNAAPARMPSRGLRIEVIIPVNQGWLPSPFTAPLIVCMPNIRMAKPIRMSPTCCRAVLLLRCSRMPATATAAVSVAVDRMLLRLPLPSR